MSKTWKNYNKNYLEFSTFLTQFLPYSKHLYFVKNQHKKFICTFIYKKITVNQAAKDVKNMEKLREREKYNLVP